MRLPLLSRVRELFWKLITLIAWGCFATMLSVMVLQVFTRYVVQRPIPWTEELSRFTYIWAIFLGGILAQRSRSHMVVAILLERLSERMQAVMTVVTEIVSVVVLGIVFTGAVMMMQRTYGILASTIPISYSYVYLALVIGSFFMIILIAGDLLQRGIRRISGKNPTPAER